MTKDPYNFAFTGITGRYNEGKLKDALLANISQFLLELGTGFAYVGKEFRLQIGQKEKFVDLLVYNLKLSCYVVIEVKIGEFKPEFLMEEGDIITPLTEQAIGLLGSTAIIPESGKYIQSQDVAKIICKEELLDMDFAFYLIYSTLVKQQLSAAAQQTKIRHTSPDKIKDCIVWIPELTEQRRIGKILVEF